MSDPSSATGRDSGELPAAVRHAAVFAVSNDAVLVTDRHGRIVDANLAAERMFGHPAAELVGRLPTEVVEPPDEPDRLTDVLNLVRRGEIWDGDITFTRSDGAVRVGETTVSGIWDADELIGAVGMSRDVTAGRQAAAALAQAEQRWRLTFDYAPIGMALVGLDGRWLRVNDALCAIVGYDDTELLGQRFQDITHPDDLDNDVAFIGQLIAGEISHYQMDKRYRHARGHLVPVSLSVALVRDEAGAPQHLVCQIEDITQRRAATDRLHALATQDPLTRLANRTAFLEQLDTITTRPAHQQQPFAIGFADLDGFKQVNDRHGHSAGDQLLTIAGRRITAALRPGDVAARVGGDEFALLLTSIVEPRDVHAIARRLLDALSAPYHLDEDITVTVTGSLGIAIGSSGQPGPALLSRADQAMYQAKAVGKNTYTIG